jgi:pyruvate,water dikinase
MGTWLSTLLTGSARRKGAAYAGLIKRYDAYLQLLRANNDFLELLTEIEAMGSSAGPCGWDRLRSALTRLNVQVFAMAKMLSRLSTGRYDGLFPVIEDLGRVIQGRLDRGRGPDPEGPPLVVLGGGGHTGRTSWEESREPGRPPFRTETTSRGFVVSTVAFRDFLRHNGLEDTIKMLWDTLDPEEPAHLWETSMTLREAALAGALPPSVLSALRTEVERLRAQLPLGMRFAVRSSASGEDSAFSFAGQYDTILHVPAGEVAAAVVKVFAGFFNPSAVMLRLKRGFGALELGMGALVMPMVEGRVSGVAYSTDPSSKDRETVRVEAVRVDTNW